MMPMEISAYDPHKGITYTYNHLNKPIRAQFRNNSFINWIYSADGTKLQEHYSGDSSATHDYVGGFFYMQRGSEPRQLLHIAHEEGRALKIGEQFRYEYNLKDHLGNIRLSFSDKNGDGQIGSDEVLSGDSYYPFGMRMGGLSLARGTENRFRYNGKEWHKELGLGLYDYGARMYDPAMGRWGGVDALAEDSIQLQYTPYAYAWNDPINLIDPDGNCPDCPENQRNSLDDDLAFLERLFYDHTRETQESTASLLDLLEVFYYQQKTSLEIDDNKKCYSYRNIVFKWIKYPQFGDWLRGARPEKIHLAQMVWQYLPMSQCSKKKVSFLNLK